MTEEVEQASKELQCEASLLFLPPDIAKYRDLWKTVGYDTRSVKDLGVRAWQDAAADSMKPGSVMFFKQLRKDRVLLGQYPLICNLLGLSKNKNPAGTNPLRGLNN